MFRQSIFLFLILFLFNTSIHAETIQKSTLSDQKSVEVTVYNSNFGLVKDVRTLNLPEGKGELRFMDVASYIQPVTVRARSINSPEGFVIHEQNYEYDLINEQKLLDKYVGQEIKLEVRNDFKDTKEIVTATLLSNNDGPIYQIGDEIYLNHPGLKILPRLPENLIAKPTLTWLYENTVAEPHELEVSYLSDNISWKADYVFVLNADDSSGELSGWVTVDNQSGAAYENARLKLVAGDVRRIREMAPMMEMQTDFAVAKSLRAASAFQEEAFFEYHMYDLEHPTTIKDRQTKQIALLEGEGIKLVKEYKVYGIQSYYFSYYQEENPKQPVSVYVSFKNSEENGLGMPLPAGIMRFNKKDSKGSLQFVGEDQIKHTPKNEEVKLKLGDVFDVVAERIQKDYQQISNDTHESEWEVTIRNHKSEDIKVSVIEPLFYSWEVLSKSHEYEKLDARTIRFYVPVPKDGEAKLTYRVRISTSHRVKLT